MKKLTSLPTFSYHVAQPGFKLATLQLPGSFTPPHCSGASVCKKLMSQYWKVVPALSSSQKTKPLTNSRSWFHFEICCLSGAFSTLTHRHPFLLWLPARLLVYFTLLVQDCADLFVLTSASLKARHFSKANTIVLYLWGKHPKTSSGYLRLWTVLSPVFTTCTCDKVWLPLCDNKG